MQPFRTIRATALLATLAAAGGASAATLQTPPLPLTLSTKFCQLRNVGSSPMSVTIQGIALFDGPTSSETTTVQPGHAVSHNAGGGDVAACRFIVSGSAKKVRAAAFYFDGEHYTKAMLAR